MLSNSLIYKGFSGELEGVGKWGGNTQKYPYRNYLLCFFFIFAELNKNFIRHGFNQV